MFELNESINEDEYKIELKTTDKDEFEIIKMFVSQMLDNSLLKPKTEEDNDKVD